MKKGRFSESTIFQVLKEAEAGVPVPDLCRKHGMSNASFYKATTNIASSNNHYSTVTDLAKFRG